MEILLIIHKYCSIDTRFLIEKVLKMEHISHKLYISKSIPIGIGWKITDFSNISIIFEKNINNEKKVSVSIRFDEDYVITNWCFSTESSNFYMLTVFTNWSRYYIL